MSIKPHRDNADAARAAAEATQLPNVRARELRSASAHDALAIQQEQTAAESTKRMVESAERQADAAARRAIDEDDEESN